MFTIIDLIPFFFDFFEPGGTNNLLPGRPLEKTQRFVRPPGSGFFVLLNGISGAFINPPDTLTDRPLGQFRVWTGVRGGDTIVCGVRLTDENMDDAIRIQVRGALVLIA